MRADRVGRGLTPTLDGLAAQGVRFTQARAPVPLTLPSHVSILTGALPPAHGVRENGIHVFSGSPTSVAVVLKGVGYRTAAFVAAYVLDRRFGLAQGFDHYDDQIARAPDGVQRLEAERPANEVIDRAIAWLRSAVGPGSRDASATPPSHRSDSESSASRPRVDSESSLSRPRVASESFFLWVHLYDPHAPYAGSYDEEVTFVDTHIGRLLQELRTLGRDPVVIVTGDHGESLGEHGESTHGMLVYDAALRVPLIVAGPGIAPARRDDPVALTDIAPTLATLAGAAWPADTATARRLLGSPAPDRETYAESRYPRVAGWSPVYALVQDRWKLILSNGTELYDISTDAAEAHNVAEARPALATAMRARVETLRTATVAAAPRSASPEVQERLRALGYVSGASSDAGAGSGPNPAEHIAAWQEFERALVEMRQGDRSALARLQTLAQAFPDGPVFQSTYARALSERGSSHAALTLYRRLVAKWSDDAVLFHELAVAARAAGRAEEALGAERAALALEPALPAAHNGIGLILTDANRHADAVAAFEAAVTFDATNAEYWVNLGNARRSTGAVAAAYEAYSRASALDPRSPDAANGLGVLLVQQQRAADAIPLFERALAASPDFIEARLNLGIAHQERGARERAAAAYREVLARARPGSPERRAAADLLLSLRQ